MRERDGTSYHSKTSYFKKQQRNHHPYRLQHLTTTKATTIPDSSNSHLSLGNDNELQISLNESQTCIYTLFSSTFLKSCDQKPHVI
uniref:Uncharacterized protein n=1 Tax=Setaria italica TaxID=4555 RepID=K3Y0F4_SETIT